MKSILYVGATLMIGASIYGFVDYKKNNHRKEFSKMYDTKEVKEPVVPVSKKETVIKEEPVAEEKIVITNEKKEAITAPKEIVKQPSKISKKKLNYKLFSRAPLERKYLNKEIKIEEPREIVEPDKKQ